MKKPKIGISIGDVNGIGLEVIMKGLMDKRVTSMCYPIIYGSSKVVIHHKEMLKLDEFKFHHQRSAERLKEDIVTVVNVWEESVNIKVGELDVAGGEYAFKSLDAALVDLKKGVIDGLVTAPINKKAMQLSGFEFPGHTEYLTEESGKDQSLMLMVNDDLRVGLITNHVALNDVVETITKELIQTKINLLEATLQKDFCIGKPKIAVLALNPHASDAGVIGTEEDSVIIPAVLGAKDKGQLVFGPFAADGFFGSDQFTKFDGILAMYHDQGLIPFKALSFGHGVNYTAGLDFIRTSPDHGTAFDIAGKGQASGDSFRKALFTAIDIVRAREIYEESNANPLKRSVGKALENPESEKPFEAEEEKPVA